MLPVLFLLLAAPAGAQGLSSVTIGAQVKFTRYETVKILDRHFTVEMQAAAKNPFHVAEDGADKTVIIL